MQPTINTQNIQTDYTTLYTTQKNKEANQRRLEQIFSPNKTDG